MSTAFERNHPVLAYRAPVIVYAIVIFAMSSIPGHELPKMWFWSFDKIVHAIEFGLFGMLLFRALRYPVPVRYPLLTTIFVGTLYAGLDELHQMFVPGRFCDMYDFLMDAAGIVVFSSMSRHLNRAVSDGTPVSKE